MKIKDGFILKEIAGSYMVVPLGTQVISFNSIIKLNETGAFLWSQLSNDNTLENLISAMISEYEVDEPTAKAGIQKFLNKLEDADLLDK